MTTFRKLAGEIGLQLLLAHTKHGADMREPEEIIGIGNADKMRKLFDNLIKAMDGESKGEKGTE